VRGFMTHVTLPGVTRYSASRTPVPVTIRYLPNKCASVPECGSLGMQQSRSRSGGGTGMSAPSPRRNVPKRLRHRLVMLLVDAPRTSAPRFVAAAGCRRVLTDKRGIGRCASAGFLVGQRVYTRAVGASRARAASRWGNAEHAPVVTTAIGEGLA